MEHNYSNISGFSFHTPPPPENKSNLLVFILSQNKNLDFFSQPILILLYMTWDQNQYKKTHQTKTQIKTNASSCIS